MKCRIWFIIAPPDDSGEPGLHSCPLHMIVEEEDVMDRLKSVYALGHTAEVEYMEDENGDSNEITSKEEGNKG